MFGGKLRIAALLGLALALCAVLAAPAGAAESRPLVKAIDFPDGDYPRAVATDSAGNLYVTVRNTTTPEGMRVQKFDSEGNPVNFTGSASYISGNTISEDPSEGIVYDFDSGLPAGIAVDQTSGPTAGYIYVTSIFGGPSGIGAVYVYKPSGEYAGVFDSSGFFLTCGVAVNPANGDIVVGHGTDSNVDRYPASEEPSTNASNGTINTGEANCSVALDEAGNLYQSYSEYYGGPAYSYPEEMFTEGSGLSRTEIFPAPVTGLGYDSSNHHLFVDRGNDVVETTTAGAPIGDPFGGLVWSQAVAAGTADRVYGVSSGEAGGPEFGGTIDVFGPRTGLPKVTTGAAEGVLQTTATLTGEVDPDGTGSVTKCEFSYGRDIRYLEAPVPCSQSLPIGSPTPVSAELTGLTGKTTYHYRLTTTSANGVQTGHDGTFTTPDNVANVETGEAEPVTKETAELHGSYTAQGLDTTYWFEIGTDTSYGRSVPTPAADDGIQSGHRDIAPVTVTGLQGATEYHYRLAMENEFGVAYGADRTFTTPPAVTDLETGGVSGVTNEEAELHGSFTADSRDVHYYFEWGATAAYGNTSPAPPGNEVPAGTGTVQVPAVKIEGLQEGGIYHYRIVAENSAGATYGQDQSFKTAEAPQISNLASKNVQATSADLSAEINPNRGETSWFFEWGPTTEYGNVIPVEPGTIPAGSNAVPVGVHLDGLTVGVTYHFRLTAHNQFGSRTTGDQAFGFYPPDCPNSQIRQETGAAHTPDCRAYELVSPSNANGLTILPLNSPTSNEATQPSRLGFGGGYGEPPGAGEPIISVSDLYVSTRGNQGWTTRYVGKGASEAQFLGGPPHGAIQGTTNYGGNTSFFGSSTDRSLSRMVTYDLGYPQFYKAVEPPSNVADVYDTTTGKLIERWPTNVEEVPDGEKFVGEQMTSADLSHFVFSSNVPFVQGAPSYEDEIQCCAYPWPKEFNAGRCCPYPVYDNNTETGEIEIASELPNHHIFNGIPLEVSADGSHIVMSETADAPLGFERPAYIRFDKTTWPIGGGAPVKFVGMTEDGSTAYFTTSSRLNGEDTDNSVDLYVWHDSEPQIVTLVSKGISGNDGNRDNCNLTWVANCDVQAINLKSFFPGMENGNVTGNHTSDSAVAARNGDIYFVSPEQLDGARGSFGEANLYRFTDGALRFVTTLEPESCPPLPGGESVGYPEPCMAGKITRMEVTPDGKYAAFVTKSHLGAYDNQGHAEMYEYTRSENRVDCVSCIPGGSPPENEVYGSQNGRFITDDGRVFFSTKDALVPSDTNGQNDVYEYVEGKPQLITTGLGVGGTIFGFQGILTGPGLIGVSADGLDAYFVTFETLVTQDHNGQEAKIYDARSGGGYPAEPPKPGCAAADECHGAGSEPPALPKDRTGATLEGNPQPGQARHHKRHHRRHHKKKHRRHGKRHHHGSRGGPRHAG